MSAWTKIRDIFTKKVLPIAGGAAGLYFGAPYLGAALGAGGALLGGGDGPTNDYTGSYPSGGPPLPDNTGPTNDYTGTYPSGGAPLPGVPGGTGASYGLSPATLGTLTSMASGFGMSIPQLLGILGPAAIGALGYSATGKATEQTLAGLTKAGDQATSLMDKNQALWAPYAAAGPGGIAGMQKYASGAGTLGSGRGVTLGSMARGG